jgi:hypothetical protein
MKFRYSVFREGGKSGWVLEGAESEYVVHSAEILLVDFEPIEIHLSRNPGISLEM